MIDYQARGSDPAFRVDLMAAVLYRAKIDAARDPEARQFIADVAHRCMAETGGTEISAADVAWAALEVIWERRNRERRAS